MLYLESVDPDKDTSEKNKYDGYMVHYDGDGTYSFSFVVDMSGDVTRTFRVKR